jgi:hypothetical protein
MIQLAAMPACIDAYSKCIQERNFPPACLKTFLNCDDQNDTKGLLPEDFKVQDAAIFVPCCPWRACCQSGALWLVSAQFLLR